MIIHRARTSRPGTAELTTARDGRTRIADQIGCFIAWCLGHIHAIAAQIGFLMARWRLRHVRTFDGLTGRNSSRLARTLGHYPAGSADHTRVEALIALNRLGALTGQSQCAGITTKDEHRTERRAAVEMIVDDILKDWLENQLYYREVPIEITAVEVFGPDSQDRYPYSGTIVTRSNRGDRCVRMGAQLDAAQLRSRIPVRASVVPELHRRWQVCICDKTWEPDSRLFPELLRAAHGAYDAVHIAR